MNSKLHWQQLSAAIFASLLLSSPAYAEVSHSQEVTLTKNGVQTQSGEVGTIEVTEEAKEGIGTGTGITDDSQKESAKTEETLPDKPIYREVRRNGITYIEKVGKETLQKESKEQEAQDEQLAARMQQQKEIAEAQNRKAPGRSFLTPDDGAGIVDEYDKLANSVKGYENLTVTKVTFEGNQHEKAEVLQDSLKMSAGTKFTAVQMQDDIRSLYETGWFYDIVPTFTRVPEGVQIVYHVAENPILTELEVEGNTKISSHDIIRAMGLKEGEVVNSRDVNVGARKVESLYAEQGYILAKVSDIRMLPDGHLILQVAEGVIEDYRVKGNTKTKDYVIIREMRMKKGDPFNAKLARRSMQKSTTSASSRMSISD